MDRYDAIVRAALGAAGLVVAVVATGASARADDPAGHFVATASMHLARDGARAVLVDDEVLVIGGENFLEGPLRSAEAWSDGGKGGASWTEAGRMQVPRVGHTVTALGDGRVLVVGGGGRDPNARLAEVWGEDDGVHDLPMFRPAGRLSVGRRFHTATLLPDGRVLVIGGRDPQERPLATAEIWDPKRRTWSATGRLHLGRCCHTATLLDDGRVLVVGGRVKYDDPDDCEDDRANHRACTTTTDSAEIWDPRTRRFSEGPNLATGGRSTNFSDRAAHTATRLADGRVLIMGGAGASEPDPLFLRRPTAYLWDQPSRRWAQVSGMPRDYHTATLLPNGSVLIVGGALDFCGCCKPVDRPGPAPAINDAWVWIPASGELVGAGRAVHPRMNHTAVALPDGRVLIAGGNVPNDETDDGEGRTSESAEIWQPGSRSVTVP